MQGDQPTALDPLDFLALDSLLDEEERAIRDTVRQFVRERVLPDVGDWFEQGILPRELIFVIDNSGSMSGPSMDQAKESLLWALNRLNPGDTFNVIRFDDSLTVRRVTQRLLVREGYRVALAKDGLDALERFW